MPKIVLNFSQQIRAIFLIKQKNVIHYVSKYHFLFCMILPDWTLLETKFKPFCKMMVICSYNTAPSRFDLLNSVSRKGGTQKPSHEGVFLSIFNTLALPVKKQ